MTTVNSMAAQLTQQSVDKLVKNFNVMPADKQQWKPLDQGRSAFQQLLECAVINNMAAGVLRNRAFPQVESGAWSAVFEKAGAENDTSEKLLATLKKATADLVAQISAFPSEKLDESVTVPFDGSVRTWGEILFFTNWNMIYHEGQLNYIQTLYGDQEYHA